MEQKELAEQGTPHGAQEEKEIMQGQASEDTKRQSSIRIERETSPREKKNRDPCLGKEMYFIEKKNYISLTHHENTELCVIFIRRGQDLHKKTTFFITALLHEMRLWWCLHWVFSLNSRAGLNVLWAKTLNIGLFQVLLPIGDMALIWSVLNYFRIRDKSQISLLT